MALHNHTSPSFGILLMNLGSPTRPYWFAVARFLREFLLDRRVIELPMWLWTWILHGIILPFRTHKNVHKYQKIWIKEEASADPFPQLGSPLHVYSYRFTQALRQRLNLPCEIAMRYGTPNLEQALEKLIAQGCVRILALPLYPQYASSTTGTAMAQLYELVGKYRVLPEIITFGDDHLAYPSAPFYINALLTQWQGLIAQYGRPERLVVSFHGLPVKMIAHGDVYEKHCQQTFQALVAQAQQTLGLSPDQMVMSYQSRFGAQKWLEPSTQSVLERLAKENIKHLAIACPGFTVDCLETLEEINIELRAVFIAGGGVQYDYWHCLNDDAGWVEKVAEAIKSKINHQQQ